jgi:hypothetical protein
MKTLSLSILLACVSAVAAFPQEHAHSLPLTVDGAKHPELIDNTSAYRHFGLHFAQHSKGGSPDERAHLDWFSMSINDLSLDDWSALLRSYVGVRERLDVVGTDQPKINAILDAAFSQASSTMSFAGVNILQNYINSTIKPTMKVYGGAHSDINCTCVFNVISSYQMYIASAPETVNIEVQFTDDSGCNHSNYSALVDGPDPVTGSHLSQLTGGMSSTLSVPLSGMVSGDDPGGANFENSLSFYCPCILQVVAVGTSGIDVTWNFHQTYFTWVLANNLGGGFYSCSYLQTYCKPSTPAVCTNGGWTPQTSCPSYGESLYLDMIYANAVKIPCVPVGLYQANPELPGGSAAAGPGVCY